MTKAINLFWRENKENVEYTILVFNQLANPIICNAWYFITEVYDRTGTKIYSFEYERGDYMPLFTM